MGLFVNPNNRAFQHAVASEIYIDKTGLIELTNRFLGTSQKFICVSRPRRFGKSTAANMLAAYYSKGCDSHELFAGLQIEKNVDYEKYLNKFDVIHLDIQWCSMESDSVEKTVSFITQSVLFELRNIYGDLIPENVTGIADALAYISDVTGNRFVIIIDEWDVLIRDKPENNAVQKEYFDFLCGLFKGVEPTKYIALAYMTGILPIKKYIAQSALNNFDEYTMISDGLFESYIGFTDDEVEMLCEKYHKDFREVKFWYGGYKLSGCHLYNSWAIISLMFRGDFDYYWSRTGTYESIVPFLTMNFGGLKAAFVTMLAGNVVPVRIMSYQNDMVTFRNKNDVLTALIHLGYLAYDEKEEASYIPNEDIRVDFLAVMRAVQWNEFLEYEKLSWEILNATLDVDTGAVVELIEKVHQKYASDIGYEYENFLSSILSVSYLSSMRFYYKPVRKMLFGQGLANFVYIPKPGYRKDYPVLFVELKRKTSVETASQQIKENLYAELLEDYVGDIFLVNICYDEKAKQYSCSIIKSYDKQYREYMLGCPNIYANAN